MDSGHRGKTVWDRGLVADEGWVANRLYRRRMLSGTGFTPIPRLHGGRISTRGQRGGGHQDSSAALRFAQNDMGERKMGPRIREDTGGEG